MQQPGEFVTDTTAEVGAMIARIRAGMEEARADRVVRKAVKKSAMKFSPIDPEAARREFAALVERLEQQAAADKAADRRDEDGRPVVQERITIGFWRVSDQQQAQDDTWGPETQMRSITAWAAAFTNRGVDIWLHDIESGTHEARVGVDLVREFAATGKVANVVSYRYDRLARSQYLSEMVEHDFKQTRTDWKSASENLPGGPLGKLMKQILVALAQYEVAIIVQRMSGGKRTAVQKKGVYAGGEPPYGYLSKGRRGDSGKGVLVVCEIEAQIVRLIFTLYEAGYGQSAIANFLNRMGVPTRKGGSLAWKQAQIRRILRQETAYRSEGLFGTMIPEGPIAHAAILPHRENPADRVYLFEVRRKALPHGTQVPDDLVGTPVPAQPRLNSIHCMTEDQARMLLRLFRLRDQGHTQARCSDRMDALGLTTLEGRPFVWRTVQAYLARRHMYEATIAQMGVTLADADITATVTPALGFEHQNVATEMAAIERIKALRDQDLSYAKIAAQLDEEGRRTRMGGKWYPSQIQRVLTGHLRRTETFAKHF